MTNREFIAKCVKGDFKSSKSFQNLYFDGHDVFSYGSHYPLLVNINGTWLLNARGYSSTTGRHIAHASAHAGYTMFTSSTIPQKILDNSLDQLVTNKKELSELSPRATRKREALEDTGAKLSAVINFLYSVDSTLFDELIPALEKAGVSCVDEKFNIDL